MPSPAAISAAHGEQEIAGHDRHEVAPAGVHALHAPPAGRLVHDVVVIERREMDELDRDASEEDLGGDVVALQVSGRDGRATAGDVCRLLG